MREQLLEMIAHMTFVDTKSRESITDSWRAHRESEALDDPTIVSELAEFVSHEPNKGCRQSAYTILGKLGRNVAGQECATVLLSRLACEDNKYVLSAALDALARLWKPRTLDISSIYPLLESRHWLVRHSAIRSLANTDSSEAEEHLLSILEKSDDADDIVYCQATLNQIGTPRGIPLMERNLKSRKRDVRGSARSAIEAIKKRLEGAASL